MWKYILKRIVAMIPVLIGVTLIVYFILSLAPGDPVRAMLGEQSTPEAYEEMREALGLNDPVIVQWGRYILNLFRGDCNHAQLMSKRAYTSKHPGKARII